MFWLSVNLRVYYSLLSYMPYINPLLNNYKSMLKKLFKNKSYKKSLLTLNETSKIYPVIKHEDLLLEEYADKLILEKVYDPKESISFLVSYAFDTENHKVIITENTDTFGKSISDIKDEAITNIDNLEVSFKPAIFNGKEHKNILTVDWSDYASELILSEKQILKAQEILGADELMISIPRRGHIYITDINTDDYFTSSGRIIYDIHWQIWLDYNSEHKRLSSRIMTLKDGKITDSLPWVEYEPSIDKYCQLYEEEENVIRNFFEGEAYYCKAQMFMDDKQNMKFITSWANFIGNPVVFPDFEYIDKITLTATDLLTSEDNKVTYTDAFARQLSDVIYALNELEIDIIKVGGFTIPFYIAYVGFDVDLAQKIEKILRALPEVKN